jgi:hypothetical protein
VQPLRREVGPLVPRVAGGVQVPVEEALPAAQPVNGSVSIELAAFHRVCELIKVEQALVASVGRDQDIYVQVPNDDRVLIVHDVDEVDIPGIGSALAPVSTQRGSPGRKRHAHSEVKQHEDPLKKGTAWPRHETWRKFELVGESVIQADTG